MSAFRMLALALIAGLLVAAALVDEEERAEVLGLDTLVVYPEPAIAPLGSARATWFCAGGTVDDLAVHSLIVTNTGDEPRQATVTVVGQGDVTPITVQLDVPASQRVDLDLAATVRSANPDATGAVSAVVEVDGGGTAVDHVVAGLGIDRAPCASTASPQWYVPYGSTVRPGARQVLVLFNPFVADAVVDLVFSTDQGIRDPQQGEGLVVPGQSSLLVDVTDSVTVSEIVAATVRARSGQVVVDRLQQFDGSGDRLLRGLAVGGSHPRVATRWFVPGIHMDELRQETLVVQNPGTERAEVDVVLVPRDETILLDPVQLTVRPGQHAELDLSSTVPLMDEDITDLTAIVTSANGVPVVVNRVAAVPEVPSDGTEDEEHVPGLAVMAGTSSPATRLVAGAELTPGGSGSRLVVFNPSTTTIATAEVTVIAAEGTEELEPVELAPLGSTTFDLDELSDSPITVVIEGSAPLVAARETVGITSRSIAAAVPYADAVSDGP